MNTLQKTNNKVSDFENNRILVEDFRYYQQNMVEYFLRIIVEYISNKNNNYLKVESIVHNEVFTYSGIYQNEIDRFIVNIEKKDGEIKQFFSVYIPRLISNNYYILNGNYYVPLFYIIDKPITIKENSISLNSLFNSITINIKLNIVIFTGTNFIFNNFIGLFLHNDISDEANSIRSRFGINIDKDNLLIYFNKCFNIKGICLDDIINHIEILFFDEYTKSLYSNCYFNEDSNLTDIIKISIIKFLSGKIFNFIDLRNKRICHIELLLAPLFKKAANIAYQAKKGYPTDELRIDQYAVLKNFLKSSGVKKKVKSKKDQSFHGLSGKTLYDLVNLQSSLLIHKASFIKPGMNTAPSSVANIHQTHFGKICPITISSIKPGETISIIPETYVDVFGQFLDLEEVVNEV